MNLEEKMIRYFVRDGQENLITELKDRLKELPFEFNVAEDYKELFNINKSRNPLDYMILAPGEDGRSDFTIYVDSAFYMEREKRTPENLKKAIPDTETVYIMDEDGDYLNVVYRVGDENKIVEVALWNGYHGYRSPYSKK